MGDERVARATAAGISVEVNGKEYKFRPVVARCLAELERAALQYYKREVLETYRDNMDLLGNGDAKGLMIQKLDEVSHWDQSDLPQKDSYSAATAKVTDEVKKWIKENFDREPSTDTVARAILSMALDSGMLNPAQMKKMTGSMPMHGRVRYDQWWITATTAGQIEFIIASVRSEHPDVTKDEVAGWPLAKVVEIARAVERITAASVGNG